MNLLGISYGFHDSAAALICEGSIAAAVEQERLTRVKHDASFPDRAADACLAIAGMEPRDIDGVAFHEKPLGVVNRQIATRIHSGPAGIANLVWSTPQLLREQLGVGSKIAEWFDLRGAPVPPVHYTEHHTSHAAAAFYPSPFTNAAVITVDGVGEWATATVGEGRGGRLSVERELRFPDSIGLLYSAFTAYCGFRVNSGEGELMGLAPYGEPRFVDRIRDEIVDIRPDGSIRLDQRYFTYTRGRRTINRRFERLFGAPSRSLHTAPTRREADLAASIQAVVEEILLAMAHHAHERTGWEALCLSGGVALNCVANRRLLDDGPFEEVWIQPAAGDSGSAIGAAYHMWHSTLGKPRTPTGPVADHHRCGRGSDAMKGAFLGPSFPRDEIEAYLGDEGIDHEAIHDDDKRCEVVAEHLERGAVIGWFGGRMEFGPRALGHRSILADPRSSTVQARINSMVKERAGFRPFAPAVLLDHARQWFDHTGAAPYMTITAQVHEDHIVEADEPADPDDLECVVAQVRSSIPAVTHVDNSARIQTVDERTNPTFARLLEAFMERTGCPVLLNTSFNARDEPIVCTPEDAYRTFSRTGLDLLVLEHCVIEGRVIEGPVLERRP